jgi:hypothetical protein
MSQTRRLAAILAADVAGYSRLMGADEVATLQGLETIQTELIDPKIAAYNGRLVKTNQRRTAAVGSVKDLRPNARQRGGCAETSRPPVMGRTSQTDLSDRSLGSARPALQQF